MKTLVLADSESSGEWLATQTLIAKIKQIYPKIEFYLIGFGSKDILIDRALFKKIVLVKEPQLHYPPFRYYRRMILRVILAKKEISKIKKNMGIFDLAISTDYFFLLACLLTKVAPKIYLHFNNFRHGYKLKLSEVLFLFLPKLAERIVFSFSSAIIIPSSTAQKMIIKELGVLAKIKKTNFIQIPNFVREDFFKKWSKNNLLVLRKKLNLPLNDSLVVYAGIIEPRKNIFELIKAFSLLRIKYQKIRLVICYLSVKLDRPYFDKINYLIKKLGLENEVHLIKDLSAKELSQLFQSATVAVLPSSQETSSVFILESLQSQLPIFSTDTGNVKQLFNRINRFYLLKNHQAPSIYGRLDQFLKKPAYYRSQLKTKLSKLNNYFLYDEKVNKIIKSLGEGR